MTESSPVQNTFPVSVTRDHLLRRTYDREFLTHPNEEINHRCHCNASLLAPPQFPVFEYLKQYPACLDFRGIRRTRCRLVGMGCRCGLVSASIMTRLPLDELAATLAVLVVSHLFSVLCLPVRPVSGLARCAGITHFCCSEIRRKGWGFRSVASLNAKWITRSSRSMLQSLGRSFFAAFFPFVLASGGLMSILSMCSLTWQNLTSIAYSWTAWHDHLRWLHRGLYAAAQGLAL